MPGGNLREQQRRVYVPFKWYIKIITSVLLALEAQTTATDVARKRGSEQYFNFRKQALPSKKLPSLIH